MADKPIHGLVSIPRSGAISRRVWKRVTPKNDHRRASRRAAAWRRWHFRWGKVSRSLAPDRGLFLTLPKTCFSKGKLTTRETV
jgi:hypothetical protein